MRYWWVNQNQTWRQEQAGGYLWSPKRNANGAKNHFYETMREVSPGDVVFAFVDTPAESDVAFDMYSGGFGHRRGLCTFEVLCAEFGVASPAITHLARIVHDLDLEDEKYGRPETVGVGRMIVGLALASADDEARLAQGRATFNSLYESFRRQRP